MSCSSSSFVFLFRVKVLDMLSVGDWQHEKFHFLFGSSVFGVKY